MLDKATFFPPLWNAAGMLMACPETGTANTPKREEPARSATSSPQGLGFNKEKH